MRTSIIERNTNETKIKLILNLDGTGKYDIDTGCGFLNHMLELFTAHGKFDLTLFCDGDTDVDYHHTAEDIAIVLGKAFSEALEDRKGIKRYGSMLLPMDEALILTAIDISGRDCLVYTLDIPSQKIGDFDTELVKEFLLGFTRSLACSLHAKQLAGENSHHIVEGLFKSLGRSLKEAVSIDEKFANEIPSTKGTII
ncbi:MAG: imidazoleglycerol-phosphate dehydratase HisB [Clostridia bacterium]